MQKGGIIASPIGDNRIVRQLFAQFGDHMGHFDITRRIKRGGEFQICRVGVFDLGITGTAIDRLHHRNRADKRPLRRIDRNIGAINPAQFIRPGIYMDQFLTRAGDIKQVIAAAGHFAHA